ncbi:MAG: hypothetical protein GF384_02045, partial [Elusimicrobia bacterium]|nr:hypothetical protein [Elusimicrobiota bacterium]MBD3411767.1 hypothetical protein [Elusimicrobiota bacterium]
MRLVKLCRMLMVFGLSFSVGLANAATLSVTVTDPNDAPIAGVDVYAITFGQNGPDVTNTKIGQTDANGLCQLTVTNNKEYNVFATAAGKMPSVRDQMMSWGENSPFMEVGTADVAKAITLRDATAGDNVRDMRFKVKHNGGATARMLMLHVQKKNNFEPAGFGVASIKSSANGGDYAYLYSVPTNETSKAYELDVYIPEDDEGIHESIDHKDEAGINDLGTFDVTSGLGGRPAQQNYGEGLGEVVYEGIVKDDDTGDPIADCQIHLHANSQQYPLELQTMSDSKGYFAFYENADTNNLLFEDGVDYFVDFMCQGYRGEFASFTYDITDPTTRVEKSLVEATGIVKGVVKINGTPCPEAWLNIWPDWQRSNHQSLNPYEKPGMGFANARVDLGSFEITGIPTGRYIVEANTPFNNQPAQYNWGPDRTSGSQADWGDDLIVQINEAGASKYATVLNAADESAAPASVYDSATKTLIVNIPLTATGNNSISGTITFTGGTAPDPTQVLVMCREDFSDEGSQPNAGFTILRSQDLVSTGVYTYEIPNLPDGTYRVEVKAPNFGVVYKNGGEHNENITLSTAKPNATVNFNMEPSGTVLCSLRKPDGTLFRPTDGMNFVGASVNARGTDVQSWGYNEVRKNGQARIEGLLPGEYMLEVNGWGRSYDYATARLTNVTVKAGEVTTAEIPLKKGVRVNPVLSAALPDEILQMVAANEARMRVVYLPSSEKVSVKNIREVFKDDDTTPAIYYWDGGWNVAA